MVNQKGHTLMELAVIIALIGLLMSFAPKLIKSVSQAFITERTQLQLQQEGQNAASLLTRELKEAKQNSILIDNVPGEPLYSRITFTKQNGTVTSIFQQNGILTVVIDGHANEVSTSLSSLYFVFPETGNLALVRFVFFLQKPIFESQLVKFNISIDVRLQSL